MTTKALGKNYFFSKNCPIHLNRVCRREQISHAFDLTETEHCHDFIEIVIILNGQGEQVLEGQTYPVSAGDVFVLQGNQKHFFRDAGQLEIVNVMFDVTGNPSLIPGQIRQMDGYNALFILEPVYRANHNFKNMLRLKRNDLANLELILNAMFYEQEHKYTGHELILTNRLQELIILLSRHYSNIESNKARALVRISKVIDYIENNMHEPLRIGQLAGMAHMSDRNFMRIFKKAVGITPSHYLNQVKIQKAGKMLRETNDQISDIAVTCGFTDSNYLTKRFKKAFGITPHKYRMRFRGE